MEKLYFVICNALQLNFSNTEDIYVKIPLFFFACSIKLKKDPISCLFPAS